jgi:sulfonate transport system permease protein
VSFGVRLRTLGRTRSVVIGILVAAVAWEIAAHIFATRAPQARLVMPPLEDVVTSGFIGMSNFFAGGFGIESTATGGPETIMGAILGILTNAGATAVRALVGLVTGVFFGILGGLLMSANRTVRRTASGPLGLLRLLPGLALAPLFILWGGSTSATSMVFAFYGVFLLMIISTGNAVGNIPAHVIEYPQTLGVRGWRLQTSVVLPAIMPEMRGPLLIAGLDAWGATLASEAFGMQDGLGYILQQTLEFTLVGELIILAAVFTALSVLTLRITSRIIYKVTAWSE